MPPAVFVLNAFGGDFFFLKKNKKRSKHSQPQNVKAP